MTHRPLLALLCLPFAALAQTTDERQIYTCDNNQRIEISFTADGTEAPHALLHFADQTLRLPQVPAASGALYRSEHIRLHTRGDEALFEDGKGNTRRCARGDAAPSIPSASNTPPAASSFIEISGNISYRQRSALPPDATLIIRVLGTSRPGARPRTLAEQHIELGGRQVPIAFSTPIDRDLIGKKGRVSVTARIEQGGKTLFASDRPTPAPLSKEEALPLAIELKQVSRGHAR